MMDLTGETYGEWKVLREVERRGYSRYWLCECGHCGEWFEVAQGSLRHKERGSKMCKECAFEKNADARRTYGANLPFGTTVQNVLKRCYTKSDRDYAGYGGRGISLWPEWKDNPLAFRLYLVKLWKDQTGSDDMSAYGKGVDQLSLDRIDNDGNYEPGNLKFADKVTQSNNQRDR